MTSSEKAKSTIVVKRIKKGGHGAHGAAWKIAYADFVTAMMAFFLLMWLLGSTTKGDLKGISEYFQSPLQVSMSGGDGAGDANSIITGGGDDLTRSAGQVKKGEIKAKKHRRDEIVKSERARMEELQRHLNQAIVASDKLSQFREQIRVEVTPDGLRIQIVDDFKRPMFDIGSARVKDYMRDILREFGKVLNEVDSKIVLTGHTDSAQYASGDKSYSNWELSADRANASRRELIAGGMETRKIVRVVGLADSSLLDRENAMNPLNRRISIIVLNKLAEERMLNAGGEIEA
jgi:chemotaxis protein MotB